MFHALDNAGFDKPAGPPALQVQMSRVHAHRIIIAGSIGGPAASPAAGTNVTWDSIGGAPACLAGGDPSGPNVSCA